MGYYDVGLETKRRILEIAKQLFYERGYQETSCALIAGEANVKVGTLHYHYPSKSILYRIIYKDNVRKNQLYASRLLGDKSGDYFFSITMIHAIYWYKFYHNEHYQQFNTLGLELIFKKNPDEFYNDIVESIYGSQVNLSDKKTKIAILSLIGIEYAISNYIIKNPQVISYEEALRFHMHCHCIHLGWDESAIKKYCDKCISIIKDADLSDIDFSF